MSVLNCYSPNFQGFILMKNALNNQVGMLGDMFLWLVANLKQGVIYFIKQALPPNISAGSVLFKRSSEENHQGIIPLQHCNITKISSESEIPDAIGYLFVIINQPPIWLNYTIDNYSCLANTNQLIDIVALYMNEPKIRCDYNEEKFPGLKIYSPKEISERNLTSMLFKSGSVILVGGNNLNEVNEFFNWVLKITRKYPKL